MTKTFESIKPFKTLYEVTETGIDSLKICELRINTGINFSKFFEINWDSADCELDLKLWKV